MYPSFLVVKSNIDKVSFSWVDTAGTPYAEAVVLTAAALVWFHQMPFAAYRSPFLCLPIAGLSTAVLWNKAKINTFTKLLLDYLLTYSDSKYPTHTVEPTVSFS